MEKEKIVFAELYWVPYSGSKQETPFYCKEKDRTSAEMILNHIIEQKAKILVEERVEEAIKNALYKALIK